MVRWLGQSTSAGTIVAPPASTTSAPVRSAESFGPIHAIRPASIARLTPTRSELAVPSAKAASWSTTRAIALGPRRYEQAVEDLAVRGHREGEVALPWLEARDGTRDALGEPSPVRERHHAILLALPDRDRHADARQVEAPVAGEGHVVVEPSPDAGSDRLTKRARQVLGELAREGRAIDRGDEVAESVRDLLGGDPRQLCGRRLQVGPQLRGAGERGSELVL